MEGKVKKVVGIALLVCVSLTGLGLIASPAVAADCTDVYDITDDDGTLLGVHDDCLKQTRYPTLDDLESYWDRLITVCS